MYLALVLGVVIGLIHYFGDWFSEKIYKYQRYFVSFVAGVTITYLFLEFLPRLFMGIELNNRVVFVWILFGFVVMHLGEMYIHKNVKKRSRIRNLKELHSFVLFIYHFMIGVLLAVFSFEGYKVLLLFWFPLAVNLFVNNCSLHNVHSVLSSKVWIKVVLALSTLLGVVFGLLLNVKMLWVYVAMAFVAGTLLYIVIREIIPKESEGNLWWFIIGLVFYVLIILSFWVA